MEMPAISITFSPFGQPGAKVLTLVPFDTLSGRQAESFRSLTLEHVSPDALLRPEIQRRTPLGVAAANAMQKQQLLPDETLLAVMRRWFWARKSSAGFILASFPRTLLQAKIFDEWLEARGESLTGVICDATRCDEPVARHYRDLGLLIPRAA